MVALVVAKRFNNSSANTSDILPKGSRVPRARSNDPSSDPGYQVGAGQQKEYAAFVYDFAVDGPLVVGHNAFGWFLPANSIVTDAFLDILTQIAGPTAVKVGLLTSGDILSTGGEGGAGLLDATEEIGTEAGWIKTSTTNYEVMLEATVAGSTAGKVVVFIGYVVGTTA